MDLSEQSECMKSFYNLKHDPFGVIVDSMVFSGAGRRFELAETIRHVLSFSHQDVLLAGPLGAGKRTLAQKMLTMLDDQWRVAWIDGSEVDSVNFVLNELVGQFALGVQVDGDQNAAIRTVMDVTEKRSDAGESFLIVVQYASQLTKDVFDVLSRLHDKSSNKDLRIRQFWLTQDLNAFPSPIEENDWYQSSLEPFNDHEAGQYLKDRFIAAGSKNILPVHPKDISRLNQLSGGIPLVLNDLARDYLIAATFRDNKKDRSFPVAHVIAAIAMLAFVVLAVVYQVSERKTVSIPLANNLQSEGVLSPVEQKLAEVVAKVEEKQHAPISEHLPVPPEMNVISSEPVAEVFEVVHASSVQVESAVEMQKLPEASDVEQASFVEVTSPLSLLERAQNEEYTLQLIGVREKAKLGSLVQLFEDAENVDIVETQYKNLPWFVLIYGQFDSRSQALNSVPKLPDPFKNQQPWIRTFGSIKADIVN